MTQVAEVATPKYILYLCSTRQVDMRKIFLHLVFSVKIPCGVGTYNFACFNVVNTCLKLKKIQSYCATIFIVLIENSFVLQIRKLSEQIVKHELSTQG